MKLWDIGGYTLIIMNDIRVLEVINFSLDELYLETVFIWIKVKCH